MTNSEVEALLSELEELRLQTIRFREDVDSELISIIVKINIIFDKLNRYVR